MFFLLHLTERKEVYFEEEWSVDTNIHPSSWQLKIGQLRITPAHPCESFLGFGIITRVAFTRIINKIETETEQGNNFGHRAISEFFYFILNFHPT